MLLIVREVLRQDDIDISVTVQISLLVPVSVGVILKIFHVKNDSQHLLKLQVVVTFLIL